MPDGMRHVAEFLATAAGTFLAVLAQGWMDRRRWRRNGVLNP